MSMRETFSNWIDLAVIDDYEKGHVMQIETVLGTFTIFLVVASS